VTTVTVSIVLHESATDVEACLRSLTTQTRAPQSVVVLDNASTDDGLALAGRTELGITPIRSELNLGFAAGQNRAIAAAPADIHIPLNPDCRLAPSFIEQAVAILEQDPAVGSGTGRLLRFRDDEPDGGPLVELAGDILDSTGMIGLRNRRVLDRGSDELADGRYTHPAYVFGTSGAAAVYRRGMLEDTAFEGEYFDESFFAYREDVDLAWRSQLLGWRCRYEPTAVARHRRRVAPGRRRQLPAAINRLSLANRWRMIAKNELPSGWRQDWPAIIGRDVTALGFCALREPRSLLAVVDVAGDANRLRVRRHDVMRRRRAEEAYMIAWFGRTAELPIPGQTGAGTAPGGDGLRPSAHFAQ
jgi:GT2 family glycosyltransferase